MSNPSSPRMQPKVKDTSRKFVLDLGRQLDCGPIDPTKYETLKHIGRGAFGSVHLIKSRKENNLFALKTMSYGVQENRTHVQREIQLLIKLMHPFVIALYDLYTEGDSAKTQTMNLVMTYCDGGDLSKLIKTVRKNLDSMDASQHKDKLYSPQNFLRWFCMSCLSLDYLHSNKILHRDIKPDNIFLSASSKNCRLGDFGLAKQLGSDEDVVKTEVGTTYYISPEIVSNKGYSYPTDVWSLGCVMYELVTLNLPYYGDNLTAFVDSLMYQDKDLRYQDEQILKVPEEIWNIILRMLDKDQEKRITVREILSSRIMRKVCKSVIDKHKPSNMNNREVREEQAGLLNQVEEIWKDWEESHPPELTPNNSSNSDEETKVKGGGDANGTPGEKGEKSSLSSTLASQPSSPSDEGSPRNSTGSPLQEVKTEELSAESPAIVAELIQESKEELERSLSKREFLPTINSERNIDGITPIIEVMNEDIMSPVKIVDRKTFDSPLAKAAAEFRFSDASPHSRSVLASFAHEITNNVIERVLRSPIRNKNKSSNTHSDIKYRAPPPLEKQTSNMSVVSTTSAENEARTPMNETKQAFPKASLSMSHSTSTSSLKATERLEKALEYGEEVEKKEEEEEIII